MSFNFSFPTHAAEPSPDTEISQCMFNLAINGSKGIVFLEETHF